MSEGHGPPRLAVADLGATVTLDRQAKEEMIRVFDAFHDRPDVRAVVLTGAGRTFSAGADL